MPMARTPRTMVSTASNSGPSFGWRHAAPMQKRWAPAALAAAASASTASGFISRSRSTPASLWWADCGQ